MVKLDVDLVKKLINGFGISGHETEVRDLIRKEITPHVDEVYIDSMGNLVAIKKGTKPKIMFAAHMDEVGLMIKRIEEKGHIFCTLIGDVDISMVLGEKIELNSKKGIIHGVITTKDVSGGKVLTKIPIIEELVIDTGLDKKQLIAAGIEIGNYLPFKHEAIIERGMVFGKALDDRLGCYILIELARRMKKAKTKGNPEIYYVFTVQEEIGMRGARPSAFTIKPDWGIAIDTTHANDAFDQPSRFLGKGPCLTIKDGEFIGNRCINGWLKDVAKKNNIPIQLEAIELGTTDASTIQTTAGGIPSAAFCVPIRNLHTTIGIASVKDIEDTIKVLEEFLKKPPAVCIV